jgi:hypothetical protein
LESSQSGESGRVITSSTTAEELSKFLGGITGLRFSIHDAFPESTAALDGSKWYLIANEDMSRIYHCRLWWMDNKGRLCIESMYLGNLSEFLQVHYDENAVETATNPGGSDLMLVRKYLAENFPLVDERVGAYQSAIEETASTLKIDLRLICKGSSRTATFFMRVTLGLGALDAIQQTEAIKLNLAGLKEALQKIDKYDADWEKRNYPTN